MTAPRWRRSRGQRGSATVLAVSVCGLLLVAALVVATLGGLLVAQRRLESGADLAALAGATAAAAGRDACAAAAGGAALNRTRLERCTSSGTAVEVSATRQVPVPLLGTVTLRSRARAGPADLRAGP